MRYSTYTAYTDKNSVEIDESWEALAQKLTTHVEVTDKHSVPLFNASTFSGTKRCGLATLVETYALILDFDNAIQKGHPDYVEGQKLPLPLPVQLEEVEAILSAQGYAFVIATSHSYTESWPRFRVVMPLFEPIPGPLWRPFVSTILDDLCLSDYIYSVDRIVNNPTQQYYFSSCLPGGYRYAESYLGEFLQFNRKEVSSVALTNSRKNKVSNKKKINPFTEEQIEKFWTHEIEDLQENSSKTDWMAVCLLHNPDGVGNYKFYIRKVDGIWYCQSGCQEGGDIYEFAKRRYGYGFGDAKKYVHDITGDPDASYTSDKLSEVISDSAASDVPLIVDEIAKQAKSKRVALVQQLVTTHELDEELLTEQVEEKNKSRRPFIVLNGGSDPTSANSYGLLLPEDTYEIAGGVLYEKKLMRVGKRDELIRVEPPVCHRVMWPKGLGFDLATGVHYVQLAWYGSRGKEHSSWYPESILRAKDSLLALDDAPISLMNIGRVSAWLTYAKTIMDADLQTLATQPSWFGEEGDMQLILPGNATAQYIGPKLVQKGSVSAWSKGLKEVLAMGMPGYRALVLLGLSAAAPLVRHVAKRNPVIALAAHSSTGKNKIINLALSIWNDPSLMRIPADSTVKGTQDRMKEIPDFPIFIDEVQQITKGRNKEVDLESVLYYAGEGQSRVTSTRSQVSTGGQRRYGVSFMAAELDVFQGIQQGAQNRVVILSGRPLPENSQVAIMTMEESSDKHCGVIGLAIADYLNLNYTSYIAEIVSNSMTLAKRGILRGDDPYTVSLMSAGLRILEEVTGEKIDDSAVEAWLVNELAASRGRSKDNGEDVFFLVMNSIMGMKWGDGTVNSKDLIVDDNQTVAWRRNEAMDPEETPLEINPTHPKISVILRSRSVKESIAMEWARKGWLNASSAGAKRKRSTSSGKDTPGAMVWRITALGLAQVGLRPDFSDLEIV